MRATKVFTVLLLAIFAASIANSEVVGKKVVGKKHPVYHKPDHAMEKVNYNRTSESTLETQQFLAGRARRQVSSDICGEGGPQFYPCPHPSPHCYPRDHVCDVDEHCPNGEDEYGCPRDCSGPNQFLCDNEHCISYRKTCNGYDDCGDGSDENCEEDEEEANGGQQLRVPLLLTSVLLVLSAFWTAHA